MFPCARLSLDFAMSQSLLILFLLLFVTLPEHIHCNDKDKLMSELKKSSSYSASWWSTGLKVLEKVSMVCVVSVTLITGVLEVVNNFKDFVPANTMPTWKQLKNDPEFRQRLKQYRNERRDREMQQKQLQLKRASKRGVWYLLHKYWHIWIVLACILLVVCFLLFQLIKANRNVEVIRIKQRRRRRKRKK